MRFRIPIEVEVNLSEWVETYGPTVVPAVLDAKQHLSAVVTEASREAVRRLGAGAEVIS